MAVLSFFHNSVGGDRTYEANDFATHTNAIIQDGIVEGLKVTYTSAYAYTIDIGKAIVMGRIVVNDAQIATAIGTPVNGDLYSVVVRMDLATRSASIETILGTSYQDDNAIKQIPLATILVGTNTLTITDKRSYVAYKSNKMSIKNSELKYTRTIDNVEMSVLKMKEGSDATGVGVSIGSGGTTIIGGGESAHNTMISSLVPDTINEKLILTGDYGVEVWTDMQNVGTDPTVGKRFVFSTNGDLNIGGSNIDPITCTIRYTKASKLLQFFHWDGTATSDTVVIGVGDIDFKNTPWITLPLQTPAVTYSAGSIPEYKKKGGTVFVQGTIKGLTAAGTAVATLPVGYRPSKQLAYSLPTSGKNFAQWTIDTNGAITLDDVSQTAAPTATDWFPITFCFTV
ncbi:hypothetical protein J7E63_15840 [Bacillus sp. ISL-75]|uniref:hypothetical protein n=1 Tax=Bacillus sp. ISL-75 TaxID=2819137 RepID=UPI001BE8DF72|nr:hypothetical protein [Bacillus sp. ISL-75]MBT2728401.1 hypothetical protein [Bacillus sp. ISL-75]